MGKHKDVVMHQVKCWFYGLAVLWAANTLGTAPHEQSIQSSGQGLFRQHLADYNSELRRPDGRVDIDSMIARLKELGVTSFWMASCSYISMRRNMLWSVGGWITITTGPIAAWAI
jgi:hypothetical protein